MGRRMIAAGRRSDPPPSERPDGRSSPATLRPSGLPGSARTNVFVAAVSAGVLFFLAIEPTQPWILILTTLLTALGTSAVLQREAIERFPAAPAEETIVETAFSLIVPVLWIFGATLTAEYVIEGFWVLPAGGAIGLGFGVVMYSEIASLDRAHSAYQGARFFLNIATYVVAFALFAAPYALELDRLPATLFVGVAAVLAAIELMREAPLPSPQVLLLALVSGVLLGEARWAMHFLPLEEFLSATLLLLAFYVATGILQSQLLSQVTAGVVLEYAVVGGTGALLIAAAHLVA